MHTKIEAHVHPTNPESKVVGRRLDVGDTLREGDMFLDLRPGCNQWTIIHPNNREHVKYQTDYYVRPQLRVTPQGWTAGMLQSVATWAWKQEGKVGSSEEDATRYVLSTEPSGIGTVIKVTDTLTGDVLDLTDYDSW